LAVAENTGPTVWFEIASTPPNFGNQRVHWSETYRSKKRWFELCVASAPRRWRAGPTDRHKVEITLCRHRLLDPDGAVTSVKPLLDGLQVRSGSLAGAGLIFRDDADHLELHVRQVVVAKRDRERTVIVIEALT
jgi:hypothetical protein